MSDTVLQLFRDGHVQQVRDTLLDVNRQLKQNDVELDKNLKLHYRDILHITTDVSDMYTQLKHNDQQFRELCFDDQQYQLNRLPEYAGVIDNNTNNNNNHDDEDDTMNGIDTSVSLSHSEFILEISNWSLAISSFQDDCKNNGGSSNNNSSSSQSSTSKKFDNLLAQFDNLPVILSQKELISTEYQSLLESKCSHLQSTIIEYFDTIPFSILQWIQLYNLITLKDIPWDEGLSHAMVDKIFNRLLSLSRETIQSLVYSSDNEIISTFIHSEQFKTTLLKYIESNINSNMEKLQNLIEDSSTNSSGGGGGTSGTTTFNDEISTVIEIAQLDSLGLTNSKRQDMHRLMEPTIAMVNDLQLFGCDKNKTQDIKERLLTFLQDRCLALVQRQQQQQERKPGHDSNSPPSSSFDTNLLVETFVDEYHRENFVRLLQSQISTLRENTGVRPIL